MSAGGPTPGEQDTSRGLWPAEAASVLLASGPGLTEVLVVRRAAALRFFGGFLAFPGGKVASEDSTDGGITSLPGEPMAPISKARRRTAARELFEETGVLLARRADSSFPPAGPDLDRCRQDLLAEQISFGEILAHLGLTLWEKDLVPIGELTTPEFAPLRFATTFFLASLPPDQRVDVWPGELEDGFWTTPANLLERWERGECLIAPPTISILETIRNRSAIEAAERLDPLLRSLAAGAIPPIYFTPAVRMMPLRSTTMPPIAYTNAYLIGSGPVYLLDPGASEVEEKSRLFDVLDTFAPPLTAILLSHQHPDHIGAAAACASRYGIPIWAHAKTAEKLLGKLEVGRYLQEGDRLPLGKAPNGNEWHLEVLHTPGHAAGHLAFFEPNYRLLFTGDMISTVSSVVIAPPDGDLAVYLESLHKLRELPSRLLFPGHGPASARPHQVIDDCLAHRAKREQLLLAFLEGKSRTVEELAVELYKGVPEALMRFARWQVLAGLQKLQQEGKVEENRDGDQPSWRKIT